VANRVQGQSLLLNLAGIAQQKRHHGVREVVDREPDNQCRKQE
jgi:hypothetical protein